MAYIYKVANTTTLQPKQEGDLTLKVRVGKEFRWRMTTAVAIPLLEDDSPPTGWDAGYARGVLVKSMVLEKGGVSRPTSLLSDPCLLDAFAPNGQNLEVDIEKFLSGAEIKVTLLNLHNVPVKVSICLWGVVEP